MNSMRVFRWFTRPLFGPFLTVFPLLAQTYTLESFTMDGGGGTSSGGVYSISGTFGQPDAGSLSGDVFTVTGGFWAVVEETVVSGSPELTIRRLSTGEVQICWPMSATGFALQEALAISQSAWLPSAFAPITDGALNCVTIPALEDHRIFRLAQ